MADTACPALYPYLTEVELRCSGFWNDALVDWLLGSMVGKYFYGALVGPSIATTLPPAAESLFQ